MGLRSGDAPELWNEKYPNKIVKLHKESVDAGSDIFLTNSFGSNALRLKLHSFENEAFELRDNKKSYHGKSADCCDRSVFVAGSVGPTGEIMQPIGDLSHQ